MTPGYTPYPAGRGLSPSHIAGYPPSSSSGGGGAVITALPPISSRAPSVVSNSSSSHTGSVVREANDYLSHLTDPEVLDIPESKERRIWELRLLHNYMVNSAQVAAGSRAERPHGPHPRPSEGAVPIHDSSSSEAATGDDAGPSDAGGAFGQGSFLWGLEIPLLAFEDDAILYAMLASSALNMWTKSGDARERDELRMCQQKYLSMALREQRQAVGNLSRDNADTVCMSSLIILQNSFALVQTLPVRPWQPPLEWLRMGKGAGSVLTVARGYLGPPGGGGGGGAGGGDKTTRFLSSMPRMDPDEMFTPANRAHLAWLLDNDGGATDGVGGDHELQDKVTLGVYNRVLSYIGTVQKAIADREPLYAVCRRFIGFAVWMPEVYHDFLTQRRPRALVTLAHFFKLWIPYEDLWLIGKTGENQVRGIQHALPAQWRHKLNDIFDEYRLV